MFRVGEHGRWVNLTWITFALLLLASSTLLIFGCKISFLPGSGYCPAPVDRSGVEREAAKREALQQRVHEAEIRLARIAPCASPTPSPSTPAQPPPERRAETGPTVGKTGRMQVTLWWHTTDDIDLYVTCNPPGNELSPKTDSSRGPGLCGDGVLDVDANRNMTAPTTSPAEHIYWKENIPAATYVVFVKPFKTGSGDKIPYSVRVEFDGEERICSGDVSWNGRTRTGHAEIPITFTPNHPLPNCATKVVPQILNCPPGQSCGGDK
jgi:hypothetical protein